MSKCKNYFKDFDDICTFFKKMFRYKMSFVRYLDLLVHFDQICFKVYVVDVFQTGIYFYISVELKNKEKFF